MQISQEQFDRHLEDDKKSFKALNDKLDLVATKKDMEQIVEAFNTIKTAGILLAGGGKWGFRILTTLAGIVIAWGIVTGGLKAAVAAIFGWAISSK
jgi:hypothetical protein